MNKNRSIGMVFLFLLIFFAISLLTNIFNAELPQSKHSYSLTHGVSGLMPLAFLLACGFMLILSGMVVKVWNRKPMLAVPFAVAFVAALTFDFFYKILYYHSEVIKND